MDRKQGGVFFQNSEQVPKLQSDLSSNVRDKGSTPLSLLFKYKSVSYQGDLTTV